MSPREGGGPLRGRLRRPLLLAGRRGTVSRLRRRQTCPRSERTNAEHGGPAARAPASPAAAVAARWDVDRIAGLPMLAAGAGSEMITSISRRAVRTPCPREGLRVRVVITRGPPSPATIPLSGTATLSRTRGFVQILR